jgi:hypothetical protein
MKPVITKKNILFFFSSISKRQEWNVGVQGCLDVLDRKRGMRVMLVKCKYPVGRYQWSCSNARRRESTYSDWLNAREYKTFSTNGLAVGIYRWPEQADSFDAETGFAKTKKARILWRRLIPITIWQAQKWEMTSVPSKSNTENLTSASIRQTQYEK